MKNTLLLFLMIFLSKSDIIKEFLDKEDCLDLDPSNPLLRESYSYYS